LGRAVPAWVFWRSSLAEAVLAASDNNARASRNKPGLRRKAPEKPGFQIESGIPPCCTAVSAVLATASILKGLRGTLVTSDRIGIPLEFQWFAPSPKRRRQACGQHAR
jgi:hypothetical protein